MKHYFAVETKCGHVGKNKCIYIWFAVEAESKSAAAAKAREYKRVKHHHKDAIRQVYEISFEEFKQLQLKNANDLYLHCQNIQQQRRLDDLEKRIEPDKYNLSRQNKLLPTRDNSYLRKKNAIQIREAMQCIRENYNIAI